MNDYEKIQHRNNFIVGAFVVLGAAAFFWLVFMFGDMPMAVTRLNSFPVYVHFESAPGIQKSTSVQYCGYHIGRVAVVTPPQLREGPDGVKRHYVTLELLIENDFKKIHGLSKFSVVKHGLSSSYIELETEGEYTAAVKESGYIQPGGEYWGRSDFDSQFFPAELRNKFQELATKLGSLADNLNSVVGDEENQQNIRAALANLADATEQAKQTLASINEFSQNGKAVFADAGQDIAELTDSIAQAADQLNLALGDMRLTLEKVNNGQGSAGKFINDGRLYENLLDSSVELQQALEELKHLAADARANGIRIKW